VLNRPGVERSMLTAYFEKNNTSEYYIGTFLSTISGTHKEKNRLGGAQRIV
jgi:hypothetical protein